MSEPNSSKEPVEMNNSNASGVCKYFDDVLFDDIPNDSQSNFFSPVWEKVLQRVKIRDLLDVGCGTGIFTCNLKSKITGKLIGVDASNFALETARRNGLDEVFIAEDFCSHRLPLEGESVDFVVCKDVFEHLLDPLYLLSEIRRVLTPEGYFLAHVPNHFPLRGRVNFLFKNDLDTCRFFPNSKPWNFPHIRFFTYETFLEFLAQAKFELVENYSGLWPSILIPSKLWRYLPQTLTKKVVSKNSTQFAQGFTVLVKKTSN